MFIELSSSLTHQMTPDLRKQLDLFEEHLQKCSRAELRTILPQVRSEVERLSHDCGLRISHADLIEDLVLAERLVPGKNLLIPKYVLRMMFDRYDKVVDGFEQVPEHARIAIDAYGTHRKAAGWWELHLLEAFLHEGMCALYNLARDYHERAERAGGPSKKLLKTQLALSRATIINAFNFVESYLNGIAFDHLVTKGADLDDKDKTLLTEWDYEYERPRHITLRDKVLQYPRIILGASRPVLSEQNVPELGVISAKGKVLRDAIVHASPAPNWKTLDLEKEEQVFNVSLADATLIVDSAVRLVRRIEVTIQSDDRRLSWLHDRGPDGYFPDIVFD